VTPLLTPPLLRLVILDVPFPDAFISDVDADADGTDGALGLRVAAPPFEDDVDDGTADDDDGLVADGGNRAPLPLLLLTLDTPLVAVADVTLRRITLPVPLLPILPLLLVLLLPLMEPLPLRVCVGGVRDESVNLGKLTGSPAAIDVRVRPFLSREELLPLLLPLVEEEEAGEEVRTGAPVDELDEDEVDDVLPPYRRDNG
jgi:hypothetical protein